jgi:hypothetical protein
MDCKCSYDGGDKKPVRNFDGETSSVRKQRRKDLAAPHYAVFSNHL